MEKVFVSWSGGKDCCLSAYLAGKEGLDVQHLANTISEDGQRSRSHGLSAEILRMQSRAMEIPLAQQPVGSDGYESSFKKMILHLKKSGITGGVFGDIDFNPHREWIDRVCRETGITPHYPLWEQSQDRIMKDFIGLGFEAVVVATRAELLGEEWLGRKVDSKFLEDLAELGKTKEITPCGEAGEYHTLVIDGPLFKQRLEIIEAEKTLRDDQWFFDISKCELRGKS